MRIWILFCVLLGTYGLKYGDPIQVDTNPVPMGLDSFNQRILTSDNHSILIWNLNGTLHGKIPLECDNGLDQILVSKLNKLVVSCNPQVYVLDWEGNLLSNFTCEDCPLYLDDVHGLLITREDRVCDTSLIFLDHAGNFITNYTINYSAWDIEVDSNTGNIFMSNALRCEDFQYYLILNLNQTLTFINTSSQYATTQITYDSKSDLYAAEYHIDVYAYNGTYLRKINFTNYAIDYPTTYLEYAAVMDFFTREIPRVVFLDWNSNIITTITLWKGVDWYCIEPVTGTVIAADDNKFKIWPRIS